MENIHETVELTLAEIQSLLEQLRVAEASLRISLENSQREHQKEAFAD